jgi:adenylate kinase
LNNIVLIAPPAAGKGTQAKMLCEKYNISHISVGDLLRDELKKENEISNYLKSQMESGKLVKDSIIIDLINDRINKDDCKNGFILDGFPRNLNQAIELDKMNKKIDYAFYLNVPKDILKQRIVGRLICPNCGKVYNTIINESKPKNINMCDDCNLSLSKRTDDNAETFEKRYEIYINETQPIINYYKNKGILYDINLLTKKEVFDEIVKILGEI